MQSTAQTLDITTTSDAAEFVEVIVTWGRGVDANVIGTKRVKRGEKIVLGEGGDFALPMDRVELDAEERMPAVLGAFVVTMKSVEKNDDMKESKLDALLGGAWPTIGATALAHGLLAAAFAFFMPGMSSTDDDALQRDQILSMKALLTASAERDQIPPENDQPAEQATQSDPGGGKRAEKEEGAMGRNDIVPPKPGHWAAQGDAPSPQLTRERALRDAAKFGMIGLLADANTGDPNAPTVPWASVYQGSDKVSASGNMWSGDVGDAFGYGVGLYGTGIGGGGDGQGVGINDVGDLGKSLSNRIGNGVCNDAHCSGNGHGQIPGGHTPQGPKLEYAKDFKVGGTLPADVIQRIVRQNDGRFRMCYQDGLRTNPSLNGRVATKFVIGRDGSVMLASDTAGSDMPDMNVRSCVVKTFQSISFPAPTNGTVQVTYPLVFSPAQ